jgi:hypothetical protein
MVSEPSKAGQLLVDTWTRAGVLGPWVTAVDQE